jgi:DNA-binding transcriptional regulator YdaS (Cro superfamily)
MPRDAGLNEAIEAIGGVAALARALGIAQPSVSAWTRIPAERVLAVEAATGISRIRLRPDLYGEPVATTAPAQIDAIDRARADEYALLALLLGKPPTADTLARLRQLRGDASPIGMGHVALAAAADIQAADAQSEFFALFIGLGRGELLPYGSYYLTGFLHERPLARLREDMARLGIERSDAVKEEHLHALLGRLHRHRRSAERRLGRPGAGWDSPINRGSHCAKGARCANSCTATAA